MRACLLLMVMALAAALHAHDAHGRSNAPPEARRLKNPLVVSDARLKSSKAAYGRLCASCHGLDGRSRTAIAGRLPVRPTDLSNYLMESMRDGEIYWVVKNGIGTNMPAFGQRVDEEGLWELVFQVRDLRKAQRNVEKTQLGPYEWKLPPGFPFPKVPATNLMSAERVELGRHLFYDRRLSLNQTQSCASCHRLDLAFTDGKPRGVGSTGEVHPRSSMSLINVAYNPVLTWANPVLRSLEQQALVPMFGDHPVELGMTGKENLLVKRLKLETRYRKLFAEAYPGEPDPVTVGNAVKAIASFERTLLAGNSPYDEFHRGDDPNAISESAKRGESLFFSERLECFHCHGGFNFTGTVDYLGKGIAEVEFHNTGLYNLSGKFSYPEPNLGLFEFTRQPEDVGKFKAPSLRNVAVTGPYMHDGSTKTLADAVEHYIAGGRTIKAGPLAGVGSDNPNKSEFVKALELTPQEKADLIEFLNSLTDPSIPRNPAWSDPWRPAPSPVSQRQHAKPKYVLHGEVVRVYPEDGAVSLYHEEIPGFMNAMRAPYAMEFLVLDKDFLNGLKPGMKIAAGVRKRGGDYLLERLPTSITTRSN